MLEGVDGQLLTPWLVQLEGTIHHHVCIRCTQRGHWFCTEDTLILSNANHVVAMAPLCKLCSSQPIVK